MRELPPTSRDDLPHDGVYAAEKQQRAKHRGSRPKKHIPLLKKGKIVWQYFLQLFLTIVELHMRKVILVTIMLLCCFEINGPHGIITCVIILVTPFNREIQMVAINVITVCLSLIFLANMIFQTNFVSEVNLSFTFVAGTSHLNFFRQSHQWYGIRFLNPGEKLTEKFKFTLIILLQTTFNRVVCISQKFMRFDAGLSVKTPLVVFPAVTREHADHNVQSCIKFLVNYGFYKFGIEICLSACVLIIVSRIDIIGLIYAICVLFLFALPRRTISHLWHLFILVIISAIFYQYFMLLGFCSTNTCELGWTTNQGLHSWFLLSETKPDKAEFFMFYDFILLILVSRQRLVFKTDSKVRQGVKYHGGSNEPVYKYFLEESFVNPVHNHINSTKSYLDVMKYAVLSGMLWATLAVVFWAGTSTFTLLSLGYVVGSFIFLWVGIDLFLWPIEKILKWWDIFLAYSVFTLVAKSAFEGIGCSYFSYLKENACWVIQLLGLYCYHSSGEDVLNCKFQQMSQPPYWDWLCFTFILFQRRYFQSCYFLHHVNELKATVALQSHGSVIVGKLRQQFLKETEEEEERTLNNIKASLNRIKAAQKKIQGPNYAEPKDHATAVLSGDYYLFESKEFTWEESSSDESTDERPDVLQTFKKMLGRPKKEQKKKEQEEVKEEVKSKTKHSSVMDASASSSSYRHYSSGVRLKKVHSEGSSTRQRQPKTTSRKETETGEEYEGMKSKFKKLIRDVWHSILIGLIKYLQRNSRDYILVLKTMKEEKRKLQENMHASKNNAGSGEDPPPIEPQQGAETEDWYKFYISRKATLSRLLVSLGYYLLAHTEGLCYLLVFVLQIVDHSILVMPLPLMALLWGCLTSVRPAPTFWIVMIAYTEITVVVKLLFQNKFFPWNQNKDEAYNALYPPSLLGIDKEQGHAGVAVCLLLSLFFHRYMLKSLGLWVKNQAEEEPEGANDGLNQNSSSAHDKVDDKGLKKPKIKISPHDISSNMMRSELEPEEPGNVLHPVDGSKTMHFKDLLKISCLHHFTPFSKFSYQIMNNERRQSGDFYTLMFFFDFINFLILLFGFADFTQVQGQNDAKRLYFTGDQIPITYLITLLTQFFVILIDRVLYLRRNTYGKLILQVVLVIIVHIWMFLVLPVVTNRPFQSLVIPQIWYALKCIYFLLSAYQIRAGYPYSVQGHFLCKKFGTINYVSYKFLKFIPFFNELRSLLSFLCIRSSLTFKEWMKMESMFQVIYENKCARKADIDYPVPRGTECPKSNKYGIGILVLVILVVVMWFPFLLFASFTRVLETNLPQEATFRFTLGSYKHLYEYTARYENIIQFQENEYRQLKRLYKSNGQAAMFFEYYTHEQVAVIQLPANSYAAWGILPHEFDKLNATILRKPLVLRFSWNIERKYKPQSLPIARGEKMVMLNITLQEEMMDLFQTTLDNITITKIVPQLLVVGNDGGTDVPKFEDSVHDSYKNVVMHWKAKQAGVDAPNTWWEVHEDCALDPPYAAAPFFDCEKLNIYTFNEKSIPKFIYFVTRRGIIGLYISVVLVTWTVLKRGLYFKYPYIVFSEMPNVNPIFQLCCDIYFVRENHEYALEEDLYAELLFLFRSPETMINLTRFNIEDRVDRQKL